MAEILNPGQVRRLECRLLRGDYRFLARRDDGVFEPVDATVDFLNLIRTLEAAWAENNRLKQLYTHQEYHRKPIREVASAWAGHEKLRMEIEEDLQNR
jgi:hypothetical protein